MLTYHKGGWNIIQLLGHLFTDRLQLLLTAGTGQVFRMDLDSLAWQMGRQRCPARMLAFLLDLARGDLEVSSLVGVRAGRLFGVLLPPAFCQQQQKLSWIDLLALAAEQAPLQIGQVLLQVRLVTLEGVDLSEQLLGQGPLVLELLALLLQLVDNVVVCFFGDHIVILP